MPILGLRKSASILGDAALGAGAGAGLGFAGSSIAGEDPILPLIIGGAGGAGLGALHGLGSSQDAAAARQAKLEDDRAKRDEALADDLVKRQRGISETFLTKYVMPRLAEQQGLVQPKAVKAAAVARLHRLVKAADAPYEGVDQLAHYSHMPTGKKRDLSPEELALVEQGQRRWLPKLFPSYSTPPHELMASPLKSGLIGAIPGGLLGAGLGGVGGAVLGGLAGKALGHDQALSAAGGAGLGAIGGGLLGAGTTGVVSGLNQRAENENILDLMKRLPPGATRRDLMSDPAYQADVDRSLSAANTNSLGNSLILASLLRD